jgi:hypothetical protein
MNKELTPLEVSKQLKDFVLEFVKNGLDRRFVRGSFDIIEKVLKAVDIINKKRVDALVVVLSKNYIEYNVLCEVEEDKLTKKEFKLIREVLK